MIAQTIGNLQRFVPANTCEALISGYIGAVLSRAYNTKVVIKNPSEFGIFLYNAFYDWKFAKPPSSEARLKSDYLKQKPWDLLPDLVEINHLDRRTELFFEIKRIVEKIVPESNTVIAKLRELFFAQDHLLKQSLVVFFNQVVRKRIYHIVKNKPEPIKFCGGFQEFDIEITKQNGSVEILIEGTRNNRIHLIIPFSMQMPDIETRSTIFKVYEIVWILDIVMENFAQIESSFKIVNK